ncbi:RHS repeat-associated core domain-containing protein [Xanthomonas sp. WHRI 10064A]|uniref:RHS repeat-associated core domain-containing protein n=1 Tax=unclassified Xanthomonas TaxID=2643310 RepID=UPI002B225DB8|nr:MULTISPECIES: RHS repeat-associated core domain-containing protein [unclassified Xanthomonas]MEA9590104.1 RHS repeat-associated core domain-containing protein [Xanthomonas sp. WHRI 10064B]MEA9617587.1 RHS repeat-associated core domain-containing protein [Xanthomonas sp. WHRI 10064A]
MSKVNEIVAKLLLAFALTSLSFGFCWSVSAQTVRYVHTDGLGSVAVLTDANRSIIERREHEPYGASLGGTVDGVGYTGHLMDSATGLTHMQQRYYDAEVGRFLSVDPINAYGSPTKAFNRYWYADNNPYSFTDPDGRESTTIRDMERVTAVAPPPPPVQQSAILTLGTVLVERTGPAAVSWVSPIMGSIVLAPVLFLASPNACGGARCGELGWQESRRHPPGYWPADRGSEEWGRRKGIGGTEGRRIFHGIKQDDKAQGGGKGLDNYGVNPDTGDVISPDGEVIGNLENG